MFVVFQNIPKNVVYINVQRGILTTGAIRFNSQFGVTGMTRNTRSKYQTWSRFLSILKCKKSVQLIRYGHTWIAVIWRVLIIFHLLDFLRRFWKRLIDSGNSWRLSSRYCIAWRVNNTPRHLRWTECTLVGIQHRTRTTNRLSSSVNGVYETIKLRWPTV